MVKYIRFIRAEMRPSGFHMTLFSIAWAEWCYHVEADESFVILIDRIGENTWTL